MSENKMEAREFPRSPEDVVFEIGVQVTQRPETDDLKCNKVDIVTWPKLLCSEMYLDSDIFRLFKHAPLGTYGMVARPFATEFFAIQRIESEEFERLRRGLGMLALPVVCNLVRAVETFPSDDGVRDIAWGIFSALVNSAFLPDFDTLEIGCTAYFLGGTDICSEHGEAITKKIAGVVATTREGRVMLAMCEYQDNLRDFLTGELARRVQAVLREEHAGMAARLLAQNLVARRRERVCSQAIIAKYGFDRGAVQEEARRLEEEEEAVASAKRLLRCAMEGDRKYALNLGCDEDHPFGSGN